MQSDQAVSPSAIICGTMRMLEHQKSVPQWAGLFSDFFSKGVRTLHSSVEYESYPLLCKVLEFIRLEYPHVQFDHIVKLAAPGFEDKTYTAGALKSALSRYCETLGVTCIRVAQWMWRGDLKNETERLSSFNEASSILIQDTEALKKEGLLEEFCCFPYTVSFAMQAAQTKGIDGLVVYRNINETEYTAVIDTCAGLRKQVYTIRPLAAGKALNNNWSARSLVNFSLEPEAVAGTVIGLSSNAHLSELIAVN